MTLQEAFNFFESLNTKTTKKSEIKIYKRLLHVFSALKDRTFTTDEVQAIENELDRLNLDSNPENRKIFFKKVLNQFEKYLKDTYSLISKDYYTKRIGGLGLSFGILFGVVFLSSWERSLGISMGLLAGMVVGSLIGRSMDAKAVAEGRVL